MKYESFLRRILHSTHSPHGVLAFMRVSHASGRITESEPVHRYTVGMKGIQSKSKSIEQLQEELEGWSFDLSQKTYGLHEEMTRCALDMPRDISELNASMLKTIEECIAPLVEEFALKLRPKGWIDLWDDLGNPANPNEARRRFIALHDLAPP